MSVEERSETRSESPASLLAAVRERAAELEEGVLCDIPIPGYSGQLVARFERVSGNEVARLQRAAQQAKRRQDDNALFGLMADLLIRSVYEVCLKGEQDYYPVDPDDPYPMKLDVRLAAALGRTVPDGMKARDALRAVIGKNADAPIIGMADRLLDWSTGASDETRETLAGESQTTLQ